MAKLEQVLILEPSQELKFKGPFEDIVASKLTLKNPTDQPVCFKVKTTAPRRYCVRPNSGTVEPKSTVTVMLLLQPFEFDPHEKNKHKFMVQTMFKPEGDDVNHETLFREAKPGELMDSKLRCVFEMPPGAVPASQSAAAGGGGVVENGETTTSAPQTEVSQPALTTTKGSDNVLALESELRKATEEIKLLRAEASSFRQENLKLKEEKLRLSAQGSMSGPSAKGAMSAPSIVKLRDANQQGFLSAHIILAIVTGLLGFFIAKFV
ncbi:Major sperm protein (MSP) domain [Trinorchestia longiramus]|nr:Major sperm protein (MSP) domain [Trinorchestia longiramus]